MTTTSPKYCRSPIKAESISSFLSLCFLSLLTKRYLKCHNFPPDGVTRRKRHPPSKIFYSVSCGLAVRTLTSDRGGILFGIGMPLFLGAADHQISPQILRILINPIARVGQMTRKTTLFLTGFALLGTVLD